MLDTDRTAGVAAQQPTPVSKQDRIHDMKGTEAGCSMVVC